MSMLSLLRDLLLDIVEGGVHGRGLKDKVVEVQSGKSLEEIVCDDGKLVLHCTGEV